MVHKYFVFSLWIWFSRGVFGDKDAVKSVFVTEGDSVTLNTDVEVQKDDRILWTFKMDNSDTLIAEIIRENNYIDDSTVAFRDRVQMDSQTGSLTIRNIRTEHSGLYKLQIYRNRIISHKSFTVAVYAPLPIPVITRNTSNCSPSKRSSVSKCSLLCSVVNVSDVSLSWYKGNSLLSSISVSDLSISLSLPLEVEYQDNNTYSCVINNPISNQTKHLNISKHCHTCTELKQTSHLVGISVIAIVLVLAAAVGFMIYRRNGKQATPQGLTITEQKNPMSEYTQIIYCLQQEDLPKKPLLDVGRTETTVNYYHSEIQKADLRKISLTPRS
ncbi:SLAM family member 9 isoform X1 [Labeo rohita]|uniref:SLAM family member 9 isoform X1 n=1 Tax=Labeo rohita TaxID=84645 RepID=UPI0021E1FABF|nr:SLAM family member 9 isoform X1 [Labeo rohita]